MGGVWASPTLKKISSHTAQRITCIFISKIKGSRRRFVPHPTVLPTYSIGLLGSKCHSRLQAEVGPHPTRSRSAAVWLVSCIDCHMQVACVHVCVCVSVSVSVRLSVRVRQGVCVYMCVCLCVCVCICVDSEIQWTQT